MRNPASFAEGERIVDVYTRAEWDIVRHRRDGVTVLRSPLTGTEREMNTHNNPRYVSLAEAERPGVWDVQPLEAR